MSTESEGTHPGGAPPEKSADRHRSAIRFPYADLETSEQLAGMVHGQFGAECSLDQLAAALGQTTRSGAFRQKVAAASLFGFISAARKRVRLTPLGRRVVDPGHADDARVEAFLNVPLYKALYESHRGALLPGDKGLEAEMTRLGVTKKQAPRARQAFQRSAEQAGFFTHGRERLVLPSGAAELAREPSDALSGHGTDTDTPTPPPAAPPESGKMPEHDPLIQGLFSRLPPAGSEFGRRQQEKWLELAKHILEMVYGSDGDADVGSADPRV